MLIDILTLPLEGNAGSSQTLTQTAKLSVCVKSGKDGLKFEVEW